MSTQRRWFSLAIGILFGAFDFYYHRLISDLTGGTVWFVLSLGIWLVPLLPIALHEARTSRSALRSAVAGLLTWCASIVSYYLTNAVHLLLFGRPSRPELHISRHRDSYFWENWRSVLYGEIPHRRRHIRMDRICRCGRARHRLGSWCRLSLQKKKRASAPFAPE